MKVMIRTKVKPTNLYKMIFSFLFICMFTYGGEKIPLYFPKEIKSIKLCGEYKLYKKDLKKYSIDLPIEIYKNFINDFEAIIPKTVFMKGESAVSFREKIWLEIISKDEEVSLKIDLEKKVKENPDGNLMEVIDFEDVFIFNRYYWLSFKSQRFINIVEEYFSTIRPNALIEKLPVPVKFINENKD